MPITPDVAQVGALLRARTRTIRASSLDESGDQYAQGEEIGTFNDDTRPTGTQVEVLIAQAVGDMTGRVGADIDEGLHVTAQSLVAIRAAMYVELSYFPEQIDAGQSPYDRLRSLWLDEIDDFGAAVSGNTLGPATASQLVSVGLTTPLAARSAEIWPDDED